MPSDIGVLTTDTALVVLSWDGWLTRATSIGADDAKGRPLAELIPGLQEFLAGQWGIEVIRANPFKRVDVGGGADAGMVDKLAPLATVATGLAMRYPDDRK